MRRVERRAFGREDASDARSGVKVRARAVRDAKCDANVAGGGAAAAAAARQIRARGACERACAERCGVDRCDGYRAWISRVVRADAVTSDARVEAIETSGTIETIASIAPWRR